MEYAVLGGPGGGPRLRLDHERFAYAGKFVTGRTGKTVAREDGDVVAVASFDRDRTDPSTARVRYVSVRNDRRGEGVGARLLSFLAARLLGEDGPSVPGDDPPGQANDTDAQSGRAAEPGRGVERVLIAVNNAFAFEAAYKAGFCYTGERTGLQELLLARPGAEREESYRRGIETLGGRTNLDESERAFLDERAASGPPSTVSTPRGA